jgi:hypothetical protein
VWFCAAFMLATPSGGSEQLTTKLRNQTDKYQWLFYGTRFFKGESPFAA